ncbi:MAG: hypothetical protein GY754_26830 [bacterium]|nr:hypothetical protein [bacterium]
MKNYRTKIISYILLVGLAITGYTQNGFAQSMTSLLAEEGGVESLVYKSDTVVLENTVVDEGLPIAPAGTFTGTISQLHSGDLTMVYIPLAYSVNDFLEVDFTLPFIRKSMVASDTNYSIHGFGDLKLGFSFCFNLTGSLYSITRVKTTFPTGDATASDFTQIIPLGYGSITFSLLQSFSINITNTLRLFLSGGAVMYMPTDRTVSSTTQHHINLSFLFSGLGGVEYSLNSFVQGLSVQAKGNFIYSKERIHSTGSSVEGDLNDAFMGVDVIPVVKYQMQKDLSCSLMGVLPVYESQDSDITATYKRDWKIYVGITKRFTDSKSSSSSSSRRRRRR